MGSYPNQLSTHGLDEGEFDHLDEKTKKKLIRLMSRIMERAYKRGVQQAVTLVESGKKFPVLENGSTLYKWRYEKSLDKSYGIHEWFVTSSIERLMMEEPDLIEIGFYEDL